MKKSRWFVALAVILMQLALGAVFSWSVFRIPLTVAHGWTISQVTFAFELTIFVQAFTSFGGGLWMKKSGPRPIAITAAILYGGGTILAGFSSTLLHLYLSYGLLVGAGLGMGYLVPIATLIRWFPEKRGMITGIAVAGFGAGALITAPIAAALITSKGVSATFKILGSAYFLVVFLSALVLRNPTPESVITQSERNTAPQLTRQSRHFTFKQALHSWQWYGLWLTLFFASVAGITLISQASPMAQEISHVTAAKAAGLIGIISIANSSGRFVWAWLSDMAGRKPVFIALFLLQAITFFLLSQTQRFSILSVFACVILFCYGGVFGTMPAFAADYFGTKEIGSIYGLMLSAPALAALFGPSLIAHVREISGHYRGAMESMALIILISTLIPSLLRVPHQPAAAPPE